jgi:hypothetical protein
VPPRATWAASSVPPSRPAGATARGAPPVVRPALPGPAALPDNDPVFEVVRRLRLSSVDRIHREARRADPSLTLSATLERLRALSSRLRWFGRSIVVWEEDR